MANTRDLGENNNKNHIEKVFCSSFISVAVMKHANKKTTLEGGAYLVYTSDHNPSLGEFSTMVSFSCLNHLFENCIVSIF